MLNGTCPRLPNLGVLCYDHTVPKFRPLVSGAYKPEISHREHCISADVVTPTPRVAVHKLPDVPEQQRDHRVAFPSKHERQEVIQHGIQLGCMRIWVVVDFPPVQPKLARHPHATRGIGLERRCCHSGKRNCRHGAIVDIHRPRSEFFSGGPHCIHTAVARWYIATTPPPINGTEWGRSNQR